MRKLILYCLLAGSLQSFGQTIRLDSCQIKARANYPLTKQYGLIEKTAEYNLSNANKAWLPQLSLSARATFQSDVTEIPPMLSQVLSQVSGHPVSFPSLSKDQYQAVVEASQLIWDGGLTNAQKKSITASADAEKQKLEVDLYALNERVNNLFFGILLMDEQLAQLATLQDELTTNYKRIEAYKQNGVAQQSDLDIIQVELINARQREADLKSARKTYVQLLSAFCRTAFDENSRLEKPTLPSISENTENKRPELWFFDAQNKLFDTQRDAVYAANRPKVGLFAQGGYGRPGLNMFVSDFSAFYIGGLRLTWNLGGFYTQRNNLNKIDVSRKNVEIQKETFTFNNNLQSRQQLNEIEKLKSTLKNDDEIIGLRSSIKKSAEAKVANGTLTVTDLMREINAENLARQTKALHEIQLYMSIYQLKNTTNN